MGCRGENCNHSHLPDNRQTDHPSRVKKINDVVFHVCKIMKIYIK